MTEDLITRSELYRITKGKSGVALVTLWDKTGMEERCQRLLDLNWAILASEGTAKRLNAAGIRAYDVAILSGKGPSNGHLVVTISEPMALSLISATKDEKKGLSRRRIPEVGLVWAGLYPMEEEIAKPDHTPESVRKMTDVGGRVDVIEAVKGYKPVAYTLEEMDKVLDWLEAGKPEEADFLRKNKARGEVRIVEYTLASALDSDPGVDVSGVQDILAKAA